jgi:hypothetical protein
MKTATASDSRQPTNQTNHPVRNVPRPIERDLVFWCLRRLHVTVLGAR